MITFLTFHDVDPGFGEVVKLDLVDKGVGGFARLYRKRIDGLRQVQTRYHCWLDGPPDVLLPNFRETIEGYMAAMDEGGACIAYGDELKGDALSVGGEYSPEAYRARIAMMHHGVVCRTEPAQAIRLPDGCFSFEVLVYGRLAEQGALYVPGACYQWMPGKDGARMWPDCNRGIHNSLMWLQGRRHDCKMKGADFA